jgi:MFS family permease
VDPVNAVYVFAPSAAGLGLALLALPRVIRKIGERSTALLGFVLLSTTLFCFGLVEHLGFLDTINPLGLLSFADLEVNQKLRTAALLAVPLGFGLSLTATSVQTYINRRVPLSHQGRTFAMQSSLKNGVAILPLATLGAAAGSFGVQNILLASPLVLLGLAVGLIQLSRYFGDHAPRGRLEELASYWDVTEDATALRQEEQT